jgi:Flp pilus assembly protein TadD
MALLCQLMSSSLITHKQEKAMSQIAFDLLLDQADAQARAGQWQNTLDLLTQAAGQQPDHAGVVNGQGTCLIQLGRAADALPYFVRLAELSPTSPEAHNNVGVTYAMLGLLPAAEGAYKKALECAPEHWPAWKNLAQLLIQQDRFDEGVGILASLVRKHPDDPEALTLMAGCYEIGGDTESAKIMFREALKYAPDDVTARSGLARLTPPDVTHIARPEHAKKLAALKGLKIPKAGEAPAPKA